MSHSYGRIVFVLLGVGLAVYLCWKISQRVDAFLYPWANERSGQPVLVGTWVGRLQSPGRPLGVKLELHRWHASRDSQCSQCDPIEGTAVVCDDSGTLSHYDISGKPADRRATHITLGVKPAANAPRDIPQLDVLRGSWRGDELDLKAELRDPGREPPAIAPLPMRREHGGALRLLCQSISADAAP
jgi:hypothetical protein